VSPINVHCHIRRGKKKKEREKGKESDLQPVIFGSKKGRGKKKKKSVTPQGKEKKGGEKRDIKGYSFCCPLRMTKRKREKGKGRLYPKMPFGSLRQKKKKKGGD